jgi:AsmA protein
MNGIFEFRSISTRHLQGKEDDKVIIDVTGKVPAYKIKYSESGLQAEEMLRRLSQEGILKGELDLAIDLSAGGKSSTEIKRTLNGNVSVKGQDIIFRGLDIDDVISKFEKTQHFDLLDVGSTFFLGPFGPAITKGSEFAQVYTALQKEKDSEIKQLVCLWNIRNGIVEAKDVALTTQKYRVAMVGKLDLVNEQFDDVIVAVIDGRGCAVVSQEVRGSFTKPNIKTIGTIQALVGPVMGVLDDTTKTLFRKKCKVFYTGSLKHPEVKVKKGLFKRP